MAYNVAVTGSGSSQNFTINGRLSLRGSGGSLISTCNLAARFDVVTNTALPIGVGDGVARGGMLSLSTSAGSATVSFDASGGAVVTGTSGVPQSCPASEVGSFCGIF